MSLIGIIQIVGAVWSVVIFGGLFLITGVGLVQQAQRKAARRG